eukprot:TRINITY_DN4682_c0_g1_i1.p2 TRINITY_DN4682_c0_g1~~TRINITY_DN4682_c0_g1_i1.p2  ORF type:complete len:289 (+),score=116.13 TRINITY_DN4682_c0_g1_i1:76-942(+)
MAEAALAHAQALWAEFDAYQQQYSALGMFRHCAGNWSQPSAAVAAYVAVVFAAKAAGFKGLPSAVMKPLFFLWNLLLSAFSVWGAYYCASFVYREMVEVVGAHGGEAAVKHLVCSDDMIMREGGAAFGPVGLAGTMFIWSKWFELGDTVFLILMGKHVSFLQWYHHASVLLYVWFAFAFQTPSALTFGMMNYIVHMVMYFYFAVSQFSRILHPIRSAITLLQLAQMVAGVAITALSYHYSSTGACSATYDATYFAGAGVMYGSYLLLFAHLFYKSYLAPKQPRRVKQE